MILSTANKGGMKNEVSFVILLMEYLKKHENKNYDFFFLLILFRFSTKCQFHYFVSPAVFYFFLSYFFFFFFFFFSFLSSSLNLLFALRRCDIRYFVDHA